MKYTTVLSALLLAASLAPRAISQAPAVDASTASSTNLDALISACEKESQYSPAFAYCLSMASLLTQTPGKINAIPERPEDAKRELVRPMATAAMFTEGYSIRQAASLALKESALLLTQIGSPTSSSGATNLVAKPIVTNLISLAIESGALTESQSGNTMTLQTNLDHLFREAFYGSPKFSYLPEGTPVLENLTVSASFATNSNSNITVPVSGSANSSPVGTNSALYNLSAAKLSSLTVNYQWTNKLTARFLRKHAQQYGSIGLRLDPKVDETFTKASEKLANDILVPIPAGCDTKDYDALAKDMQGQIQKAPAPALFSPFKDKFNDCFDRTLEGANAKTNVKLDQDVTTFNQALAAHIAEYRSQLKSQLPGWEFSSQYVYSKPVSQPVTHDVRFIASGKTPVASWTLNAAASFYGSVPSGAKYSMFKDAQFSGELDRSMGSSVMTPSFSLAGYGQYQYKPSILNLTASSVPSGVTLPPNAQAFIQGTQGWLGVVQAKFTFHLGGAQIPLGIKWSNKTNLLDKTKIGAQFGVSYDLSNLKQLMGGGQ